MNYSDMARIMDTLFNHRAPSLPPNGLADVLDRMIWCLDDQGASLLRVREEWLDSDDRERLEIALSMDETFPFVDAGEMLRVFSKISERWPDLAERCNQIMAGRSSASSNTDG